MLVHGTNIQKRRLRPPHSKTSIEVVVSCELVERKPVPILVK